MTDFCRREALDQGLRPLDQDVDSEQAVAGPTALELENLERDLRGAAAAAGQEEADAAVAQVVSGAARPQELMEWIDDLREPEQKAAVDDPIAQGFLHDFAADTDRAAATDPLEIQRDTDHAPEPAAVADDDYCYLFPAAVRRRRGEELDEDGEPIVETDDKTTKKA